MRERSGEVEGDGAAQGEAYDAESLGAPVEGRRGSGEEELQGEEAGGVWDVWRLCVAAAPEVWCGEVRLDRIY